jgi:hypothetical protein
LKCRDFLYLTAASHNATFSSSIPLKWLFKSSCEEYIFYIHINIKFQNNNCQSLLKYILIYIDREYISFSYVIYIHKYIYECITIDRFFRIDIFPWPIPTCLKSKEKKMFFKSICFSFFLLITTKFKSRSQKILGEIEWNSKSVFFKGGFSFRSVFSITPWLKHSSFKYEATVHNFA